jgi:uncharacterized protein YqgV (UPF0045/DUF77 family)
MNIMVEISMYPLKTESLSEPIKAFLDELASVSDLEVQVGNMSTQVTGESKSVFSSLERAFSKVAESDECVMILKVSNACPYSSV